MPSFWYMWRANLNIEIRTKTTHLYDRASFSLFSLPLLLIYEVAGTSNRMLTTRYFPFDATPSPHPSFFLLLIGAWCCFQIPRGEVTSRHAIFWDFIIWLTHPASQTFVPFLLKLQLVEALYKHTPRYYRRSLSPWFFFFFYWHTKHKLIKRDKEKECEFPFNIRYDWLWWTFV